MLGLAALLLVSFAGRTGLWLGIGLIVISTLQRRRLETALVLGLLWMPI